jgi:hypothetical protein
MQAVRKKILPVFVEPEIYYRLYKILQFDFILSQVNSVPYPDNLLYRDSFYYYSPMKSPVYVAVVSEIGRV